MPDDPSIIDVTDGIVTRLVLEGDRAAVQYSADVEANLDLNKALATLNDGYSDTRELRRVASIPVAVQFLWIQKYGVDPLEKGNEELLRRLLNDPENMYLRTAPGRL